MRSSCGRIGTLAGQVTQARAQAEACRIASTTKRYQSSKCSAALYPKLPTALSMAGPVRSEAFERLPRQGGLHILT